MFVQGARIGGMTNLLPNLSTLPAQFAELLRKQDAIVEQLKIANKPETFQPLNSDKKSLDFEVPAGGEYVTSAQIKIRRMLISASDVGGVSGLCGVTSGESNVLFQLYMNGNLGFIQWLEWDDESAPEIARGLRIRTFTPGAPLACHIWASAK